MQSEGQLEQVSSPSQKPSPHRSSHQGQSSGQSQVHDSRSVQKPSPQTSAAPGLTLGSVSSRELDEAAQTAFADALDHYSRQIWRGDRYDASLRHSVRILPDARMEGFFICRLRKHRSTLGDASGAANGDDTRRD